MSRCQVNIESDRFMGTRLPLEVMEMFWAWIVLHTIVNIVNVTELYIITYR